MPRVDFSNVKELEVVEADDYDAKLSEYEYIEKSKSGGKPYYKFTFEAEVGDETRKFFRNFSVTPDSLWALKRALIVLGVDEESFGGEVDLDEVIDEVVGNSCIIEVAVKEYEGRDVNEVRRIKAPGF